MSSAEARAITPKGILSYPHLDEPQDGMNGGAAKYSATIVFAPGTDLSVLKAAANFAGHEKWGEKWGTLVASGAVKTPFRTDAAAKGYADGSTFINTRSAQKPGVVSSLAGSDGKPVAIPADKVKAELYAGCAVRLSVAAFAYDTSGNKGVSFALNNVQKLGEGDRIDGRRNAQDEFDADLSATPADLASLGIL